MIRKAQINDINRITDIAENYYAEHWFNNHTKYDKDKAFISLKEGIIGPYTHVIVLEENGEVQGFSVSFLDTTFFSHDFICSIGFMYIEPPYRNIKQFRAMVDEHKKFAKEKDAVLFNIDDGGNLPQEKFKRLATVMGFTKHGSHCWENL